MSENGQEKRETLADIVAELRDDDIDHADLICFREDGSIDMTELAGRIEAAWKREKSQSWHNHEMEELVLRHEKEVAELKDQTGNAAAIYNALKTIHDKVNRLDEECCVDPVEIRDLARAALSAPARNCDMYATYAEAAEAHKEYATAYIMRASNKFDFPMEFDEWLFAPAEEKGEGDGR